MWIIFSGWGGLLPAVFAVIGFFAGQVIQGRLGSDNDIVTFVVFGVVSAGLSWMVGSTLNNPSKDRVVTDPKTEKQIKRKRRHSLMFVPIQYYAIPFALITIIGIAGLVEQPANAQHSSAQSYSIVSAANAEPAPRAITTTAGVQVNPAYPAVQAAAADDDTRGFSWTIKSVKDRMTGEVANKAVGEIQLADGALAKGEVVCDPVGVIFTIKIFRGSMPVAFRWDGNLTSVRTRVNNSDIKTLTVTQNDGVNSIDIWVLDPVGTAAFIRAAVGAQLPAPSKDREPRAMLPNGHPRPTGDDILGLIGGAYGNAIAEKAVAKMDVGSVGKLGDFPAMRSILVELALSDRSANVVQLNPDQAELQSFASACKSKLER